MYINIIPFYILYTLHKFILYSDIKVQWTEPMTTLLLVQIEESKEKFDSKTHKVWKEICNAMNEFIPNVTPDQCYSKWKNLKRRYTQIKDNNNRTGAAPQEWIHFDAIDNILKERPEIAPLSLASSTAGFRICKDVTNNSANNSSMNASLMDDINSNNETATVMPEIKERGISRPIPTRKSQAQKEPYWCCVLREQRERHHKENLLQKERFLSLLEKEFSDGIPNFFIIHNSII